MSLPTVLAPQAGGSRVASNARYLYREPPLEMTSCNNPTAMPQAPKEAQTSSLPVAPSGIEAIVCADITRRQALGIAKYGTTVAENPLSLREWLNHAYEETLDKAVYLRRAMAEIDASPNVEDEARARATREGVHG
jgi:hypothetical protein